jgi:putative hydrolase of the HAD superfamily
VAEPAVLLWDIGGVILSNGWDREDRSAAAQRFGLDPADLEARHAPLAADLETGRIDWAAYLAAAVFDVPRTFSPEEFRRFVWDRSGLHARALGAARALRAGGRYTMVALNNESRELNAHRIEAFDLRSVFHVFLSSCYTGLRKPDPAAFRYALAVTQRPPSDCLFLDDRKENVDAARGLGLATIWVREPDRLPEDLLTAGVSLPGR